ncbi:MAG: phosphomannomutase/phosphoglucomutase [Magnetococcales bacterium]|nr:phosphomannomutase/phosphoglucomutase [Magnetococcales bacterium]
MINPLMFREYDIRGIAGQDLTAAAVTQIGQVFAAILRQHSGGKDRLTVAVGRDGRLSSPELAAALIEGIRREGVHVVDIGLAPTPALYFATHHLESDAGIMVTGSHNPPDYNGLKMVRHHQAVYGQEIQAIYQRLLSPPAAATQGIGQLHQVDILPAYMERLTRGFRPGRPLRVVVDCGNGATGVVVPTLMQQLPLVSSEILFAEVDGTFPNHHPDPTLPENLVALKQRMMATGADLGIAFDGDGDRIGALDPQGNIIWGDRLMILFATDLLRERPGATVIGDVKCSQLLFDAVAAAGGQPLMWKTGHSLIKAKMRETGALLAGEMSGHLFFSDRYLGYDDGLYAAVRLIELAAASSTSLTEQLAQLPEVHATPELRLHCADDVKFQVMERIAAEQRRVADKKISDIDGIRVQSADGWWLLRVSNTQPALVARVEAYSAAGLQRLTAELAAALQQEGIAFTANASH